MNKITVTAICRKEVSKVWELWTRPEHIVKWTFASSDWHCPHASNDLKPGGTFLTRMEARDGSAGFDFTGTYLDVSEMHLFRYRIEDGRQVDVSFEEVQEGTRITETFDPENIHPADMQKTGWQSILDNFVSYAESLAG